nr:hypothetical protein [uncultured Blautia sp.]
MRSRMTASGRGEGCKETEGECSRQCQAFCLGKAGKLQTGGCYE